MHGRYNQHTKIINTDNPSSRDWEPKRRLSNMDRIYNRQPKYINSDKPPFRYCEPTHQFSTAHASPLPISTVHFSGNQQQQQQSRFAATENAPLPPPPKSTRVWPPRLWRLEMQASMDVVNPDNPPSRHWEPNHQFSTPAHAVQYNGKDPHFHQSRFVGHPPLPWRQLPVNFANPDNPPSTHWGPNHQFSDLDRGYDQQTKVIDPDNPPSTHWEPNPQFPTPAHAVQCSGSQNHHHQQSRFLAIGNAPPPPPPVSTQCVRPLVKRPPWKTEMEVPVNLVPWTSYLARPFHRPHTWPCSDRIQPPQTLDDFETQREVLLALKGALYSLHKKWQAIIHPFPYVYGDISPRNILIQVVKDHKWDKHVGSGTLAPEANPNPADATMYHNFTKNAMFKSVAELRNLHILLHDVQVQTSREDETPTPKPHNHNSYDQPATHPPPQPALNPPHPPPPWHPPPGLVPLDYLDDLESFYYTLAWLCISRTAPGEWRPKKDLPKHIRKWMKDPLSARVGMWKDRVMFWDSGSGGDDNNVNVSAIGEHFGLGVEHAQVSPYFGEPFKNALTHMRGVLRAGLERKHREAAMRQIPGADIPQGQGRYVNIAARVQELKAQAWVDIWLFIRIVDSALGEARRFYVQKDDRERAGVRMRRIVQGGGAWQRRQRDDADWDAMLEEMNDRVVYGSW